MYWCKNWVTLLLQRVCPGGGSAWGLSLLLAAGGSPRQSRARQETQLQACGNQHRGEVESRYMTTHQTVLITFIPVFGGRWTQLWSPLWTRTGHTRAILKCSTTAWHNMSRLWGYVLRYDTFCLWYTIAAKRPNPRTNWWKCFLQLDCISVLWAYDHLSRRLLGWATRRQWIFIDRGPANVGSGLGHLAAAVTSPHPAPEHDDNLHTTTTLCRDNPCYLHLDICTLIFSMQAIIFSNNKGIFIHRHWQLSPLTSNLYPAPWW